MLCDTIRDYKGQKKTGVGNRPQTMRLVPIFKALNHLKCPNPNLAQRTGQTLSSSQESQLGTLGFGTTAWCTAHWDSLEESRKRTSCVIRTNFWSIVLDDHWSKTIYRPKGSCHLCFSGIRPLRGYPPPLLTENQSEKKKVFFLSGKGGYPPPP